MEVTTKKQNRRKIVSGVLIAVVVLVAAVIAFASSYLVNYAIGRSGDGGDREVALDVEEMCIRDRFSIYPIIYSIFYYN